MSVDFKTSAFFKEIVDNVRDDREKVKILRDKVIKLTEDPTVLAEAMMITTAAEQVARLSDVLTKMNSHLVELAKISARIEHGTSEGLTEDADSIYDEIEASPKTN